MADIQAEEVKAAQEPQGGEPQEQDAPKKEGEAPAERSYSQSELDRIISKVKKNTRYSTRREIEAYYQGRGEAVPRGAVSVPAKEPAPVEDNPPKREQYDSYEAYIEEKAAYQGRKAAREYREQAERESRQQRAQEDDARVFQGFNAKVREKFPDLEERAAEVAHIQMPPGMGRAIAESDIGPEILNHLIDTPKELERIAALPPSTAIREIGKLEARLEAKPQEPEKKVVVSKAPAPIAPGAKPAAPQDDQPSDGDTIEQWMQKERQRMRKQRG